MHGELYLVVFINHKIFYYYEVFEAEVGRNSFSARAAEPWNKLSKETREAKNVQQFKRMLKNKWK